MTILRIQNITKKYVKAENKAVDNLSLEVPRGEILGLVGASGSGKTTLLRLIAGLEHPQTGKIELAGQEIVNGQLSVPAHKRRVGMVFQDYALFPHLTILENVKYGLNGKDVENVAKHNLELVGIVGDLGKYPHQLSGGQQQRVALARAMAPAPAIILLDEPFSNLDETLKDQVREDIRQIIKKTGATAIFVTHDTRDALTVADRIAILKNGTLVQLGTPIQLYNHPIDEYVANFFGRQNQLEAIASQNGFETAFGKISVAHNYESGHSCKLFFRPEHAHLCAIDEEVLTGTITKIAWFGSSQTLTIAAKNEATIEIYCRPDIEFAVGNSVSFKLTKYDSR